MYHMGWKILKLKTYFLLISNVVSQDYNVWCLNLFSSCLSHERTFIYRKKILTDVGNVRNFRFNNKICRFFLAWIIFQFSRPIITTLRTFENFSNSKWWTALQLVCLCSLVVHAWPQDCFSVQTVCIPAHSRKSSCKYWARFILMLIWRRHNWNAGLGQGCKDLLIN